MAKKMAVRKQEKSASAAAFLQAGRWSGFFISPQFILARRFFLLFFGCAAIYFIVQKYFPRFVETWPVKQVKIVGEVQQVKSSDIDLLLERTSSLNMLSSDVEVLRKEIRKNSWIKLATVVKQWPETLVFELVEYQPVALWNGNLLLESGEFVHSNQFEQEELTIRMEKRHSPIIRVTSSLQNSQRHNKDSVNKQYLLKVVSQFSSIFHQLELLGMTVEQFNVDETNSWTVELKDQKFIQLGRKLQQKRLENFVKVYHFIDDKKSFESIDLRYKNGLAVKYRERFETEASQS